MRDTILFDINETVLDLTPMKARFDAVFSDQGVAGQWFASLLHSSCVSAMTGVESTFADLAGIMLDAMAARHNVSLSASQRADILTGFTSLPAHADVVPALNLFRQHGYRTVAFTNSSWDLVHRQLTHAGLMGHFDDIISVEATGRFKPDPLVYRFAATELERPIGDLRLVATHDWDTHGALYAGMRAAYINRTGAEYHLLYQKPECLADDMVTLAEHIIALDKKAGDKKPT
ncbi:MAG: haloacid dehalogenase type II [Alphaproteobacteria bacterium]|nr:haloacid dehalogenase type II [Alphaproteobacteria bacterium]